MSSRAGPVSVAAADLSAWVGERATRTDRFLLGITGPPGSGKSTLAARLGAELGAPVVPMDGFHRSNADLDAGGLRSVKGAPDTFDGQAFVDLVSALRNRRRTVRCPAFDRTVDEPVDDQIGVTPQDALVVVEGNYLLLDRAPWSSLRGLLDVIAYVEVSESVRLRRLIDRHVEFGRNRDDAIAFATGSDARNAALVEASRSRADLVVFGDH